ncbi:hypothetical protein THER5_0088 [Bifidobacterium thermacidophilum subsp. thermacidophilum]|uniref:Uncharacterized protein n=1 Tax=Bifidobacterium thermacidophilum subsp. thermacidophilum TaxID=79262 RepID=A0A087E2A9_9BIFI|nr:hypothetical protein THER5_0088 [Bifidobacterium thermacidophilum subsp. thermacidophilum]
MKAIVCKSDTPIMRPPSCDREERRYRSTFLDFVLIGICNDDRQYVIPRGRDY